MSEEAKQATPHRDLIDQLLDSRIPKSEREHAAAREISELSVREAHLRARVAELEAACRASIEWDDREKDHGVSFYERMELCERAFAMVRAALEGKSDE